MDIFYPLDTVAWIQIIHVFESDTSWFSFLKRNFNEKCFLYHKVISLFVELLNFGIPVAHINT